LFFVAFKAGFLVLPFDFVAMSTPFDSQLFKSSSIMEYFTN
jgi:hypothetical protein